MGDQIRFYGTNRAVPEVGLGEALLQGQAADRGLFLPRTYPSLSRADLAGLRGRPYAEVARAVLRPFTAGVFDENTLAALCAVRP